MLTGIRLFASSVTTGGTPAPVLTSLDFDLADAAGGDLVTITGTDLGGATLCTVGGTSASIFLNTPTSLTFTMPAKTAGSHNVQVTTLAGASNTLSIDVWAPTAWRGPYSGSPWNNTSGAYGLTEATNPPSVGTAVNGYTPVVFDGADDQLANGSTMSTFITTSAFLVWALFYPTANGGPFAGAANAYANPTIWTASTAHIAFGLRYDGGVNNYVQVFDYDGSNWNLNEHLITLNSWNLLCCRYDGTNLRSSLNGGAPTVAAAGHIQSLAGSLAVGRNSGSSARFAGRLMELGFVAGAESDARFNQLKARANARYALSL